MSAYFVETATIDRIITAWRTARAIVGMHEIPSDADLSKIGRCLLAENARSVSYRYSLADGSEEGADMASTANAYSYGSAAHPLPPMGDESALLVASVLLHGLSNYDNYHALGVLIGCADRAALAEYDYQACETDDYRETAAGLTVAMIESETMQAIELMRPAIVIASRAAAEGKRASDASALKSAVARLIAENPHLTPGGREVVEKNIRAELKRAFPGVKFSVRKGGYHATRIEWTDGPTCDEVEAVANCHKAGHFDGMDDSYHYRHSAWGEAFGAVQYITTSRHHSDAATLAAIAQVAEHYGAEPIALDDLYCGGWNCSPIVGERSHRYAWAGLVNRALENTPL